MSLITSGDSGLRSPNKPRTVSAALFDVDSSANKNFQSFSSSGSCVAPSWATKVYYLIVAGGATASSGATGGNGGQVVQGNTTALGNRSITVTVGGAGANSSIAISGGSTISATGAGGASAGSSGSGGSAGTQVSAPFAGRYGGGGGGSHNLSGGWLM